MKYIRKMMVFKIREGKAEEYVQVHEGVWPELVEEHRKNGTIRISSFLDGHMVYVFFEFHSEAAARLTPADLPVRRRWQEMMREIFDPTFSPREAIEVFYLETNK